MAHKMALLNNKTTSIRLLSTFSILILLVTIDIYFSVLSPTSCDLVNEPFAQNVSSNRPDQERLELQDESLGPGQRGRNGIVFQETKDLKDTSVAGDKNWDNLFASDGYLYVKPKNASFPREPWGVSMFHGLHCLQILRNKIQNLEEEASQSGSETLEKQEKHGHHHDGADESDISDDHYKHCFSYLVQSIICAVDDTIEPPHIHTYKNGSYKEYSIDGVGTWHQCRDQSLIRKKILESEENTLERWDYKVGDTVQSVWG
ncbi:hypothetical protein TSTA_030770 [Talaromyces stipitatus ATCC 10500]|uniref:Uncharacterized protein n=1 Tax=Talaromyces stipitatus (strain ATCC 10500 / CBS 375.48 / QM 6759 / NRRL 1006) TaxID=441959 RepID=B8M7T5_TALSN|nr:uncharacterized protein TSTA_030770 [Talaromyces stipitatus ATCC 10500]EED19814.1 hypothetical protein TSTA_030770 [Talaromyces stipitatus ATCC 10500]